MINIRKIIDLEKERQQNELQLIASENYTYKEVLYALGSVFTNRYSEGLPKHRYYGGQKYTDLIEEEAIKLSKDIFNADHANVQPLSGCPANLAVYNAWCDVGDTILGMRLDHGGHLSHGSPVSIVSKFWNFVHYGVKNVDTGEFDFDEILDIAKKNKPKIILVGYSAYTKEIDYEKFKLIADEVGAIAMADVSHIGGLIAAKMMKNPIDYGFNVLTTTTHKTLRGPRGAIIVSKGQTVPFGTKPEKKFEFLPSLIDRSVFPGIQGGPHMNQIAALVVALQKVYTDEFKSYAQQTIKNAKTMAQEFKNKGYKLVFGDTDNHMILLDLRDKNITGDVAQNILEKAGIITSKSTIPYDTNPPTKPSGLRLGSPALTTRGLKENEFKQIVEWIDIVLKNKDNENILNDVKNNVSEMLKKFPIYNDL